MGVEESGANLGMRHFDGSAPEATSTLQNKGLIFFLKQGGPAVSAFVCLDGILSLLQWYRSVFENCFHRPFMACANEGSVDLVLSTESVDVSPIGQCWFMLVSHGVHGAQSVEQV